MPTTHFILATAGHVDHGKSALVRALSGTDPDRLPEEKARGITIELGFAYLDLLSPPGVQPTGVYRVGIVDVPGHEDFVKNMVAGVGSIDLALLVVAADDGWMPQTEEHLQILCYLGATRGVVALTKADLVESDSAAREQIREKLRDTPLAEAPIISTSMVDGRGVSELKSTLAAELSRAVPQRDLGKPRLAVDRVFTLRGAGTVVTGTLTGGMLRRGQTVLVQPNAKPARIRTIQSYNADVPQATPGARVALNLPDLQPRDAARADSGISRGDVVTLAELGRAGDTIDALLEMSGRSPEARPLKEATRVRVHHGSGNMPATAYFQGVHLLEPGKRVLAQFRFESPVFAFAGDRFVVRDWSEQQTIAGGVVLDPDAPRRGFRTETRRTFLQVRAQAPGAVADYIVSELSVRGAASRASLLLKSRFAPADIESAADRLAAEGKVVSFGGTLANADWWQALRTSALEAIDAFHKAHPEQIGPKLAELRQAMSKKMGGADVFENLVEDLCRHGCARAGVALRRTNHRPALPPLLQPAGSKLRAALAAKPLEPPSRKELAPDSVSQQALRFLVQAGEAVEIGEDLVLPADPFHRAVETIRAHIRSHGGASVSELRQVLNTSRRVMVPLLEKLDRDGVTVRQGDKRILRPAK